MKRLLASPFVFLLAALAAVAHEPETILRRAWIPSAARPQGEIRLADRSSVPVIEVLLHTRLLSRVVARIRDKEKAAWPDGSEHADASRRYLEALEQSAADVRRAHSPTPAEKGAKPPSPKLGLLIEIGAAGDRGFANFSDVDVVVAKDGLEVRRVRPLRQLDQPVAWAKRTVELIRAEHFGD
ncbi:MAG: hypothetical protein ACREQJ_07870 [Candidatus Binatia bacterium]